jgi:hypothetical protein
LNSEVAPLVADLEQLGRDGEGRLAVNANTRSLFRLASPLAALFFSLGYLLENAVCPDHLTTNGRRTAK